MVTTEESFVPKSLHALFMRPGIWGDPLDVSVTEVNNSRSFAIRRVELTQKSRTIAELLIVAHRPEAGHDRQHAHAPSAASIAELAAATPRLPIPGIMEVRPLTPVDWATGSTAHPYWARFAGSSSFDPVLRCCATSFVSDYMVISTPFPKGSTEGPDFLSRTLSHTVWFHRPLESEWMLVSASPLTVGEGRFTSTGTIHDEEGRLVASFVQEGILRPQDTATP